MNPFPIIFGLYPGWEGLTKHGRWRHLAVAGVFACLLDLVLLLTCYWTDYLPYGSKRWYFIGLGLAWLLLAGLSSQMTKRLDARRALDSQGDLFQEVLTHYLQGNWAAAESCALALIKYNPQDAEALLLLATLYRHQKRTNEARETLYLLKQLETAEKWYDEIIWEERELARPEEPEDTTDNDSENNPGNESDSNDSEQNPPDEELYSMPHIFVG